MTARVILNWIVVVVLCAAAAAATQKTAGAETYAVRVVRDVPYLEGGRYADGKDKLDIYLPEGRRNTAVIVSYYGNQLMGGDKSEDAYIGRRFAAAVRDGGRQLSPLAGGVAPGAHSGRGCVICLGEASHCRIRRQRRPD